MNNNFEFSYSVLKWVTGEDENPTGVLIQIDNGDTQYLTIEEYKDLVKSRIK